MFYSKGFPDLVGAQRAFPAEGWSFTRFAIGSDFFPLVDTCHLYEVNYQTESTEWFMTFLRPVVVWLGRRKVVYQAERA